MKIFMLNFDLSGASIRGSECYCLVVGRTSLVAGFVHGCVPVTLDIAPSTGSLRHLQLDFNKVPMRVLMTVLITSQTVSQRFLVAFSSLLYSTGAPCGTSFSPVPP